MKKGLRRFSSGNDPIMHFIAGDIDLMKKGLRPGRVISPYHSTGE